MTISPSSRRAEVVEIAPGAWGGVVSPVAYADGLLFVPVVDFPTRYTSTGYDQGVCSISPGHAVELVAIDATTGRHRLVADPLPTPAFAGATVANDVVFTAGLDGVLRAFEYRNRTSVVDFPDNSRDQRSPGDRRRHGFCPRRGSALRPRHGRS